MRDHRSLEAWQEARAVVLGTLELTRCSWKSYAAALFPQLQRASLSVQLNIAKGYAYGKSRSFDRHLAIAYGSAVETGEILEIAVDAGVASRNAVTQLLTRNQRVNACCSACLNGVEGSRPLTAYRSPLTFLH